MVNIDWNSSGKDYGNVIFGTDNDLVVNFYWKSVIDNQASEQQQVKIFKNVEYVKIFRSGELTNVVDRPIEPQDKKRFERQWQNFTLQKSQMPEGTPIDVLFPNNPAAAETLKSLGIYTIQQCSNLSAHAIDQVGMGGQEYVNKAKTFLKSATSGAETMKLYEQVRKKDAVINQLTRQVDELTNKLNGLITKLTNSNHLNTDAATGMPEQKFVPGYDAQTARINNVASEKAPKFRTKPMIKVEDEELNDD